MAAYGVRKLGGACALALVAALAATSPAIADGGGKDCAPVGALPDYLPAGPAHHDAYDAVSFFHKGPDGGNDEIKISGQVCKQEYDLKNGGQQQSNLEMQYNYRSQFDSLGAETTYKDDYETDAKLAKDGHETWLKVITDANLNEVHVTVVNLQPMKQTLIAPSGKDYRLLGHMPNYAVTSVDKSRFDEHAFLVHSDDGNNRSKVEGARYDIEYDIKKGAHPATPLEIATNYRNALKQIGAEILYAEDDESSTVARYDDHGQAIWMQIDTDGDSINIYTIEEKAFQASIKPPDASAMKTALDKDGHIALYIHFDFDKATLRPDAAPIIAQVVSLLQDNPDLRLSVEGNTDNIGGHDYNVKLSKDRAASVVAELVKAGIAADRLKSSGNGPDKPITDNDDSMGRAKNRRVELVKLASAAPAAKAGPAATTGVAATAVASSGAVFAGTWQADLHTLPPQQPPLKSQTLAIAPIAGGYSTKQTNVQLDKDGGTSTVTIGGKILPNGKPFKGGMGETRSCKNVNATTIECTVAMGPTHADETYALSAGDKTLTDTLKVKGPDGKEHAMATVYKKAAS